MQKPFLTKNFQIIDLNRFQQFWIEKEKKVFGYDGASIFQLAEFEFENEAKNYIIEIFQCLKKV